MDAKLLEPSGEAALAIAEVMLERSAVAPNGTRRWVMRIVAIGVGAVVAFGLVGMCARMK